MSPFKANRANLLRQSSISDAHESRRSRSEPCRLIVKCRGEPGKRSDLTHERLRAWRHDQSATGEFSGIQLAIAQVSQRNRLHQEFLEVSRSLASFFVEGYSVDQMLWTFVGEIRELEVNLGAWSAQLMPRERNSPIGGVPFSFLPYFLTVFLNRRSLSI